MARTRGGGKAAGKAAAGILSPATAKLRRSKRLRSAAAGGPKPAPKPGPKSGPVDIKVPKWATPAEKAQFREYVKGANEANRKGLLSKSGRVASGSSGARKAAEREARAERLRAKKAGKPYQGVAAHIPDATWLGHGKPYAWGDHTSRVNSSIAGQQNRYPIGYKPSTFRLK
ncbi:hypothetical protein [Saccharopolyspora sp. NPDC002686]|uniref:hypothetical protein n=1 Tax=Saccharopolyspora sp. NPDC002686 TaxID=3154541 RepID=UPI0033191E7F